MQKYRINYIDGLTAAELIYSRIDHKKPNMGLTIWKDGPGSKIHKSDCKKLLD